MNLLAEKLQLLRLERGLTLRQAAELAGVAKETISDLEHGRRKPFPPTLYKIATGYGIPPRELLERTPLEQVSEPAAEEEPATPLAQAPPPPETSEEGRRCLAAALDPWANLMYQLSGTYRPLLANLPEAPPLEKLREYQWVVHFTLVVCARIEAQLSDQSFQEIVGPWVSRVDAKEHVPPNILKKVNRFQEAYTMLLVEDDGKAVDWVQRQKGRVHEASTEASAELLGELERFLAANDPPIKRSSHRG